MWPQLLVQKPLVLKYKHLNLVPGVDCEWNDWTIGDCSRTCAGGLRTNSRTKKREEINGTDEVGICEGDTTMEEECNTQNCTGMFLLPRS